VIDDFAREEIGWRGCGESGDCAEGA